MTATETIGELHQLAGDARSAAGDQQALAFVRVIGPLADALDLAADLLAGQQRFLLELRNCKADT